MNKWPVIIDLDTGCDDAIELVLATLNDIQLKGFTCTAGNISLDHVVENTTNILGYIHSSLQAYVGCEKPLKREFYTDYFHGQNGLGNIELPKVENHTSIHAIDYIYKEAIQNGKIVLLCSGPLTNIATLLLKHPDVKEHIKEIVFMGGSLQKGNVTDYAEFNAYTDPEAYEVVLKVGIPLKMIGLDVTMMPSFNQDMLEEVKTIQTKEAEVCRLILEYLLSISYKEGDHQTHLHDVLALFALIHPEQFTFKKCHIDAICEGVERGRTKEIENQPVNCEVAVDVNVLAFCEWFFDSLKGESK